MALLVIENLHIFYGHVHALKGISLAVQEGEILALLGANGAGKTTTLRAVSGLVPPRTGRIVMKGKDIRGMMAHDIVRLGVAHAPEGRRVFATLTVEENLDLGGYTRGRDKKGLEESKKQVFQLFPRLRERRRQLAGTLSGGEQQMLSIGRALMADPKLLLLDEPSLGLAPLLVKDIFQTIREINKRGVTILLVEQNARVALKLAHRGVVLETGNLVLAGTARELLNDERVKKAYLGEK
ncbi:MAG: ABC transporter ATP-binding protein [Moorella sp. (in: Bacteria)]|nr:ABC transporter ATP-binding protein [Moorella sp. (in: firmicutes)]